MGKSSLLRFNWFGYGRGNWSKPGYLSKGPETDLSASKLMREAIKNKESIKITILNYNKNKEKYWFELNITTVFDSNNNSNFIGVGRNVQDELKGA
jgi:hypothetical protein